MEDVVHGSVASARWWTILLAAFAGMALTLAALGVFGVLSYLVTQRAREIGIRLAVGATGSSVRRMVLRQGLSLALIGAALGLAVALVATRVMSSMLYGIGHTDPVVYVAVAAVLLSVGALASYLPARRATRVDPVQVLRQE
jgi:ABC-type antimicrobial peptide transport system permease subunit